MSTLNTQNLTEIENEELLEESAEHEIIFESYQRLLLQQLRRVKEALNMGNLQSANDQLDQLIADTEESVRE